jgi:type IV pilus assembly protein PilA
VNRCELCVPHGVLSEIQARHSPDGYDIGVNVGRAAGQSRMHVHVHLIPRYRGDVPDPRGGVRCVLAGDRGQNGFTLIEMMVVIGIIAILALMMVPTYQDRLVRDQIVEALPLADIAKTPVAAAWSLARRFPADNAAAGLPPAEKIVSNLVSAVFVQDGAIHVLFGNRASGAIKGKTLSLRPAIVEDAPIVPVAWVCGYAAPPGQMTVKGNNRTDVPDRYLPLKCRP